VPRIELIPDVLYQPQDPYHWEVDNLPLKNILRRQNLINLSVDNLIEQIRDAIGTQGSVSNRLNQSIDADGSLKASAIDDAMHSIESHQDTVNYVKMTRAQSDKLNLISDEATSLSIQIDTDGSSYVLFDEGVIEFQSSSSIVPVITAPNIISFELGFPVAAAHQHFYGATPIDVDLMDPDYINYTVDSAPSQFIDGSLRVYVNGVRIFEDNEVYVPGPLTNDPWTLVSFTSDFMNGSFALSSAISEDDIIRIDYDISFV
jgi:hypothetical protein